MVARNLTLIVTFSSGMGDYSTPQIDELAPSQKKAAAMAHEVGANVLRMRLA
jgi:hypothetical protein